VIDPTTESGERVMSRLRDDLVAWLVTVRPDGTPMPTPVWFWWDGETMLVYSEKGKPKLRNIEANPHVAVALRTDRVGSDLAVITGDAVFCQRAICQRIRDGRGDYLFSVKANQPRLMADLAVAFGDAFSPGTGEGAGRPDGDRPLGRPAA